MKEIETNGIKSLTLEPCGNSTHYLVIQTVGDMRASALRNAFGYNKVALSYIHSQGNKEFDLRFEIIESQEYFDCGLPILNGSLNGLDIIYAKLITEIWVCYPDKNNGAIRFGESVYL